MRFVPNRSVIMQQAHLWLREHEARQAANGGVWFGKPVTLATCLARAWQAAEQETYYAERGYNRDLLFYVIAVPDEQENAA